MANLLPLGMDSDRAFYTAHFMDLAMWEPFLRRVCIQHGFGCFRIDPGIPGTFPTFIVELNPAINRTPYQSVVVKFFGPLFNGADSFRIEKELGQWLSWHSLPIGSPAILADGTLDKAWSYLIFEKAQGVGIRQVGQSLSTHVWRVVAEQMGLFMKRLHTVSAINLPEITQRPGALGWSSFMDFLESQRASCLVNHQQWADLPSQFLPQVQDFLLPLEELLDLSSPPHLIHADLTGDHLLGQLAVDRQAQSTVADPLLQTRPEWDTLAIIDWGDARIGNILYELVALHLGLFQADKRLLKNCLEIYGLPDFYRQDFARKALCMILLHQFPMPTRVYAPYIHVQSMNELAQGLFGI